MKVAIVSITRTHLLNLAISLDRKDDIDVVFYTSSPKRRLRKLGYHGKIVSCFFLLGMASYTASILFQKMNFKWRLHTNHMFRKWFDIWASYVIKPCDILVGANGDALYTSRKAKQFWQTIIICDQGSEHINTQDASYKKMGVYTNPWNTRNLNEHYAISDYMMVPSEYVKQTDIENGIDKNRILYDPYGVDVNKFHVTDKPEADIFDVVMVGNWCVRKGCDMLASVCLKNKFKLLHVGVITDTPFPSNNLFTHVDFVPESTLPNYLSKAKVFILPSRNEGFGLVLSQAASCGLVVVGSSRTGMPDLIKLLNQPDGCYQIEEPLSEDTIATALNRAIKYADTLQSGPRNHYKLRNNLSWFAYGERYYNILKELQSKLENS